MLLQPQLFDTFAYVFKIIPVAVWACIRTKMPLEKKPGSTCKHCLFSALLGCEHQHQKVSAHRFWTVLVPLWLSTSWIIYHCFTSSYRPSYLVDWVVHQPQPHQLPAKFPHHVCSPLHGVFWRDGAQCLDGRQAHPLAHCPRRFSHLDPHSSNYVESLSWFKV